MKIVLLDSSPLDNGDLDMGVFDEFGQVENHKSTFEPEIIERVREADVVFTNKVPVRAATMAEAGNLKFIGVFATGYDIIDVEAASDRGIKVCNVPSYSTPSTAQTTISLMLELTQRCGDHSRAVKAGRWHEAQAFCFWEYPLVELDGKTVCIVGMGQIGAKVARIAEAFGMRVIAAQLPGRHGGDRIPLQEAFEQADVISLHCPATPETVGLINSERLSWMKSSALIVNSSRGALVDETDMLAALQSKRIAGYACDVLGKEPPEGHHPFFDCDNCIVTPHMSWATFESRSRLLQVSVDNLRAFLDGNPQNIVNA